ncbi:ABC transporter permease [Sneathiella chinensis]|uniref:Nitrate ABC transporter n=1 Tax=Sneathiella chinensis TaxID=349750 RepID=A0ABQ5U4I1_9PROT|nr:ABC transporter permease [Sneathiella chinensis]GLQ06997.1 nitrate ABC transporter [Sneathiella chinensis]
MIGFLKRDWTLSGFLVLALVSFTLPVGSGEGGRLFWTGEMGALILGLIGVSIALFHQWRGTDGPAGALLVSLGVILGAAGLLLLIDPAYEQGTAGPGLWLYLLALGLYAWRAMDLLSRNATGKRALSLLVPALFGMWLIYVWQVVTTGFQVPSVLLPSPVQIAVAFAGHLDILAADFYQTFVKSVLSGFVMGCGAGFLVAILVDRIPFMQRGLLPLGSLVSAIPIVGIAPIMVMWFGFDWQSKAAVIVVMTFFPMLVNTLAGLEATSHLEKDLMRSYAASYFQTLLFVRLPNALPFIFNALKINSTLALIGAIVAEFFGTPIVGMGFRISTEVGRMNVDIVWATIAVAALAGSLFYGGIALIERSLTFWHPSYRGKT